MNTALRITIEPMDIAFSVCKVTDYSGVDIEQPFVFTGCTDEEKSLVCPCDLVPENATHCDDGWRAFRICGEMDFSVIGILAGISKVLAENGIGIFAVSTYNTDYIMTKEKNFEKAVQALREAGYRVLGEGTMAAEKKSWLKTQWNKILRLMQALDRELYIDDQIEIADIWDICERMIESGRLKDEPWELRKSIVQEIVRGGCFDEYGVMDPMEDLLEALCLNREEKLVFCGMVFAERCGILTEKCVLFYKECGMLEEYYGYRERSLGEKQAPYLELIDYYKADDEEKAVAIAELGMKKCKDSQTELVMFLIQKSVADGDDERAARLMQSAKLRRAIDYKKVQEAFPGVRPWTKKEWGECCGSHFRQIL